MDDSIRIEIIKAIKENLRINDFWLANFLMSHNIDLSDPTTIDRKLKELKNELKELTIPEPVRSFNDWVDTKEDFITGERIPQYKKVNIYANGITEVDVKKLKKGKKNIQQSIYYLEQFDRIVKLYLPSEDNSKENSANERRSLSGHGELRRFTENFIKTSEFMSLNIPKHETLKANHIKDIENILKSKYSNYDINFNSFLTILRKVDYSKPREKF